MATGDCWDCGGIDFEWMRQCQKHKGVEYCRGCECPYCAEETEEEDEYSYVPESKEKS